MTRRPLYGQMAYTSEDLAAIRAAIARGERVVQFADRSITYRSMEELIKAEDRIAAALRTSRSKQSLGVATKGF